jgi:cysteinyl-tRNA synthetase
MCNNEGNLGQGDGLKEVAQPNSANQPRGLGGFRQTGKGLWANENSSNQEVSKRRTSDFSSLIGGQTLGKILSQLEELRAEYDSYTGSHKERLETRLEESKVRREQFFAKADALRDEILKAVQQQEAALNSDALDEEA